MQDQKNNIWGTNIHGQLVREHDKIECGNGLDKWITHVQIDPDTGKWHRENDYFQGKVVGSFNPINKPKI